MTAILKSVEKLISYHKSGQLKGEVMPEDDNPQLPNDSEEALCYFTLPMALNYQRNSYALWKGALASYNDPDTAFIFSPKQVVKASPLELQQALLKHKVALQPNKHPQIWMTLCQTLVSEYGSTLSGFFKAHDFDVVKIMATLTTQKKKYPYLAGPKISNYWLYVLSSYTSHKFKNLRALSVAPDTHVVQASIKLGLVPTGSTNIEVATAWEEALKNSAHAPIDIHTPLWLWSRQNFLPEV